LRIARPQTLFAADLLDETPEAKRISTEQSLYHPAVDIGEPKIPALKAVG
jgi:hypothetical protein